MSKKKINYVATFKPKCLVMCALAPKLIHQVEAVLTQGMTVTADSVWIADWDLGYSNCLSGLVDGKLSPLGYDQTTHCCASTNPTTASTWLNIDMGTKTVVQTVLILNREEGYFSSRIIGSELYVGDSSLPYQNTPCGALPQSSGVYSCGGKIGRYLGIYEPILEDFNICQIRAYPYQANAYTNYQYLTSNIFAWSTVSNLVMKNEVINSNSYKMPVQGTPAYYNIVFNATRFIHSVTLVGNYYQDFSEAKNWFVTVGSQTGAQITQNAVVGQYVDSNFDRMGKEIKVGIYGQSVGVYRNDGQKLSFRWIAVFTTASNCSGLFDWSGSRSNWRIPILTTAQVITGSLVAKIDDCAVFHGQLVQADGLPLPSFISYDVYTKIATVNVGASQSPSSITVKACAYLNDKVTTAKSECKEMLIKIFYADHLVFTPATLYFETEQLSQQVLFNMPVIGWIPADAQTVLTFSITTLPNFLTLPQTGNTFQGVISANPTTGTYSFQIKASDSISNKSVTLNATVLVYSCQPTGFSIQPTSLTVRIQGPSLTSYWSKTELNLACGTYSTTFDTSFAYLITVNGQSISAQAPQTALGTFYPIFTLKRDSNHAQATTASLNITILSPLMTSLIFSPATTFYFETELPLSQLVYDLPEITWAPVDADKIISFQLIDAPSFLTLQITGPKVKGVMSPSATIGTFTYQVTVLDSVSNLQATLNAKLYVYNCQPTGLVFDPSLLTIKVLGPIHTTTWSFNSVYSACGSYILSVETAFALSISISGAQISVSAPQTSLGLFSPTLTLKRNTNASQAITAALTVTITACKVTSFTFSQSPTASTTLRVGIDSQPHSIQFATNQSPFCNYQVLFALEPNSNAFLTVSASTVSSGQVTIQNANINQHASYALSLNAIVDGEFISASLKIIIVDPCSGSVFEQSPSPLRNFTVMLAGSNKQNQTIKVFTDIERQHPTVICPINAVIVPYQEFITISSDSSTLTVDEKILTSLIPQSVKTYEFTLRVTSMPFPSLVQPANITFNVVVACTVTQVLLESGVIPNLTYEVNPTELTARVIQLPVYRLFPCLSSMTYSRQLLYNSTITIPSFISYSDQQGTLSISLTNPKDTGIYNFSILATESVSGLTNTEVNFTLTLTCTISLFYNTVKNVKNVNFTVGATMVNQPISMAVPVYGTLPDYCLLIPVELSLIDESTKKQPTFANLTQTSVSIQSDDPSLVGSFTLRFTAKEMRQGFVDNTVSFKVTLSCEISDFLPVYSSKTVFNMIYALRTVPVQFTMPSYTWQPSKCKKMIEYKLENQTFGAASLSTYPSFFKFDLVSKKVTLNGDIQSFSESDKEFTFKFVATTTDGQVKNLDYEFKIKTLFKNSAPNFKEALKTQVLTCGQSFQWDLPFINDPEGDKINPVTVKFSKSWLKFDDQNFVFSFDGSAAIESSAGQYVIPITLTDQFGASTTVKQTIIVIYIPPKEEISDKITASAKNATSSEAAKNDTSSEELKPAEQQKKSLNETATEQQAVIGTQQQESSTVQQIQVEKQAQAEAKKLVETTSSWDGWKVLLHKQNQNFQATQTSTQSSLPPQFLKIKSVSQLGRVLIEFGNPVKVPPEFSNQRRILSKVDESILVLIKADQSETPINYNWKTESFKETEMQIQLSFANADQISIFNPDIVIVQILDPALFQDAEGGRPQTILLGSELPRQIIPGSAEAQFAEASGTAGAGAKGVVIGNFILTLLLSASLNQLWSMVEAQQIVVIIPMFNITIPPSSAILVQKFMEIANFDIIPVSWIWNKLFFMPPSQALPLRFATLGLTDSSLFNNNGGIIVSTVTLILLYTITVTVTKMKKACKNQKIRDLSQKLQMNAYWKVPVTIAMESFTILLLSSLITIKYPNWNSKGQIIETIIAYCVFLVAILCLVIFPFIMNANREQIIDSKSTHLRKFAPLYEELDRKNAYIAVFRFVFMFRRLLLALTIVMIDILAFQLLIGFMQCTMTIITIGFVEPYEKKSKWIKELLNEQIILATIYFAMCFSQLVPDPHVQAWVGYAFCGMLATHIVSFLGLMLFSSLKAAIKRFKRNRFIAKHKKAMKQTMQKLDKAQRRQAAHRLIAIKRQEFDLSEQKYHDEIDNQYLVHTFGYTANVVTVDLLKQLANISIKEFLPRQAPVIQVDSWDVKEVDQKPKSFFATKKKPDITIDMINKLKNMNSQEFAVKEEPIEDCTLQSDSPKWQMPQQEEEEKVQKFEMVKQEQGFDLKQENFTFVDSWDNQETIDNEPVISSKIKLDEGHCRNESLDLLISQKVTQEMLDEQYDDWLDCQLTKEEKLDDKNKVIEHKNKVFELQHKVIEQKNQAIEDAFNELKLLESKPSTKKYNPLLKEPKWGIQTQAMLNLGKRRERKFL